MPDDPLPPTVDLVLGVGADVSRDGGGPSKQSAAVAEKAMALAEQHVAKYILFCGGYRRTIFPEAVLMSQHVFGETRRLRSQATLLIERDSKTTRENALFTLPYVQEVGARSVIIVAQQWHARRVRATFRRAWAETGIRLAVVKAFSGYGGGSQRRWNHFLTMAAWDSVAWVISRLRGYC